MGIPVEVQEYFKTGKRKLVNVAANDNYSLTLQFDDNETRIFEVADMLTGVLTVLKDKDKFKDVFIDSFGNIAWDIDKHVDSNIIYSNRIDLSADNAYIYGERCVAASSVEG